MEIGSQVELVNAYGRATVALRDQLARLLDATWLGLGSWREQDVSRWLDQVVPTVQGAVGAMSSVTDAYLSQLLAAQLGRPAKALAAKATYPREGVAVAEVYRRPFLTVWTALSKGGQVSDAINAGRARAVNLATTDLQLAKRNVSAARLAVEPRVVGYRRVLTGSKSCAMCALAATQRYRKQRLMPIHPACNCAVAPIVGDADPGQRINAHRVEDLAALDAGDVHDLGDTDALHAAISKRFGFGSVDFRGTGYHDLVVEHEHGELGTVMARKGDKFTGPADL